MKVECVLFNPERRYTQKQLMDALGMDASQIGGPYSNSSKQHKEGTEAGLKVVATECDFIKYCKDKAATLPEHDWYAMISNLANFKGGAEYIHEISSPYPGYDHDETDEKIQHFLSSGTGPMTCRVIADKGYRCPKLGLEPDGSGGENGSPICKCKAPAGLCYKPMTIEGLKEVVDGLPLSRSHPIANVLTATQFIEDYLYNIDPVIGGSVINYYLKEKFSFKTQELSPLVSLQRQGWKEYEKGRKPLKKLGLADREDMMANIPKWYDVTQRGLSFKPDVLARELSKSLAVFFAAGQFYHYDRGVYRPMDELDAKNTVREHMLLGHTRLSQIIDATGQWRMQITKSLNELNPNPFFINVRNGLYNVLEDKLYPHSPDYLSTVQLQLYYTPGAECPLFERYLHRRSLGIC